MAFVMNWYKAYTGMSTNTKLKMVAAKAGCSLSEVVHFWLYLLELACGNTPRGSLRGLDREIAAFELGMAEEVVQRIYAALEERGLVAKGTIAKWKAAQDNPAARMAAKRDKEKSPDETAGCAPKNEAVTSRNKPSQNVTSSKKERERTPNGVLDSVVKFARPTAKTMGCEKRTASVRLYMRSGSVAIHCL